MKYAQAAVFIFLVFVPVTVPLLLSAYTDTPEYTTRFVTGALAFFCYFIPVCLCVCGLGRTLSHAVVTKTLSIRTSHTNELRRKRHDDFQFQQREFSERRLQCRR